MKSDNEVTTKIILETWRSLKDSTFSVKLRVTHNRKQKFYILKDENKRSLSMTKEGFIKVIGVEAPEPEKKRKRLTKDEKELRLHINELEKEARDVIKSIPAFTFEAFEAKYFNKKTDQTDVFSSLETRAKELREEGRISTAVTFECTLNSLKAFHLKKSLPFENITILFLRKYEQWMTTKIKKTDNREEREANSLTTVGMYLRNVRAVYNRARREGVLKDIQYPFGEGGYQIPTGTNRKKALTQLEVGKILNYDATEGSPEEMYRDFWMFSYLCNGINVKDMARITYKDIDGDIINITRAKTERETRRNPKPITIIITRQIGQIIDKWGNKPAFPDTYLLPILIPGITPEVEYRRIQDVTKLINRYMSTLAAKLEIPMKVTTYTARHSYATVLKRSGASTEFISESLGHRNLQTTENYLADFEIEEKRKWAEKVANI